MAAMTAIGATRAALAAEPKDEFAGLVALVRNAGADLEKGVAAGAVTDAGEYEDGWGYIEAARAWATRLAYSFRWSASPVGASLEPLAGGQDAAA